MALQMFSPLERPPTMGTLTHHSAPTACEASVYPFRFSKGPSSFMALASRVSVWLALGVSIERTVGQHSCLSKLRGLGNEGGLGALGS
jgi:hypothetical protein